LRTRNGVYKNILAYVNKGENIYTTPFEVEASMVCEKDLKSSSPTKDLKKTKIFTKTFANWTK